jgi:hypothetical protein
VKSRFDARLIIGAFGVSMRYYTQNASDQCYVPLLPLMTTHIREDKLLLDACAIDFSDQQYNALVQS